MHWQRILRYFGLLLGLAALWLLAWGEQRGGDDDLQLAASSAARPGETLPLRAYFFAHVEAAEGPALSPARLEARLLKPDGTELGPRVALRSAQDGSAEGALVAPSVVGRFAIEVTRRGAARALSAWLPLEVSLEATGAPLWRRSASPLQHLSLSGVRAEPGARAPSPFEVAVPGGACVPELPCALLSWLGAPAASLRIRPGPGLEVLAQPAAEERVGLRASTVRVRGFEGQLTLVAARAGSEVAARAVRLPVALGEPALWLSASLLEPGDPPPELRITLPPGRSRAILDVFAAGDRWRATRSLRAEAGEATLRLEPAWLTPGLLRVQVRTGLFDSDGAGARLLYVRGRGEPVGRVLQAVLRRVREVAGATAARGLSARLLAADEPERAVCYALSSLEGFRAQTPTPRGQRTLRLAQAERGARARRYSVGALLALCALLVGGSLLRRGVSATTEARAIVDLSRGEEPLSSRRRPGLSFVIAFSLAVCLAFLLAALLIVAKPLWF